MIDVLLVVLLLLPALAALVVAATARRSTADPFPAVVARAAQSTAVVAIALSLGLALGHDPAIGPADQPWVRFDALGAVLAVTASLLGVTVLAYAARNLQGDRRGPAFASWALTLLSGVLLVATAGRLSTLVLGWVATSLAIVGLVGYRGDTASAAARNRTAVALGIGDGALLLATALVLSLVGDPSLSGLSATTAQLRAMSVAIGPISLGASTAVALLLVVAALARGAQAPFSSWLPGTLATPTPVSALLHAGAVNAGGVLLVRTGDLLGAASPAASGLLVGAATVTILVSAGTAQRRADVKGALATSTSAQMGFMLLAVGVAAPLAAVTHLVGHAFYKAARFLGAGDSVRHHAEGRRWGIGHRPTPGRLLAGLGLVAVGLVVAASALGVKALQGADAWVVGGAVVATVVTATGSLLAHRRLRSALPTVLGLAASYLAVASALGLVLADSLPGAGPGHLAAAPAMTVLAAVVATAGLAARSRWAGPRLDGWLLGRVSVGTRRPARPLTPAPRSSLRPALVPNLGGTR